MEDFSWAKRIAPARASTIWLGKRRRERRAPAKARLDREKWQRPKLFSSFGVFLAYQAGTWSAKGGTRGGRPDGAK